MRKAWTQWESETFERQARQQSWVLPSVLTDAALLSAVALIALALVALTAIEPQGLGGGQKHLG